VNTEGTSKRVDWPNFHGPQAHENSATIRALTRVNDDAQSLAVESKADRESDRSSIVTSIVRS